ncbi:MAG TPA: MFS transporter [Candidatus Acidoferrum sp.]|nr:MFS transporter [Candidatus Acidoferrum sp.]
MIAAAFLVGTGVGSIFPILPLFLRERGGSYALVGVIVGANLIAQFIGQYPAGRLSDRLGRRPVMIGGLLIAGVSIAAFALPVPVVSLIVIRFIQGLGGAAYRPGSRAVIGDLVIESRRGMAFSWLTGAETAGLIVGPALGGVLAVFGRAVVFEVTALAMLLAALVLGLTLNVQARRSAIPEPEPPLTVGPLLLANAAIRGVAMVSMGIGFLYGLYGVVWSLFMKSIGASDWEVGLSLSLFALPLVLTAPLAGWASDRFDRRWLAVTSASVTALLAPVYPLVASVWPVIGVGVIEATTAAFTSPSLNAFLMSSVTSEQRGRAAGAVGTAESAARAAGALLAGALFGLGVAVPFVLSGVVGLALILLAAPSLRIAGREAYAQAVAAVGHG